MTTPLQKFRTGRLALGFLHTSAHIPGNRKEEFSAFVLRLRGEYMLELADDLPDNSPELDILGNSNMSTMPSGARLAHMKDHQFAGQAELVHMAKEVLDCISKSEAATAALEFMNGYSDRLRCRAKAVAYSVLAEATWKELLLAAKSANIDTTIIY